MPFELPIRVYYEDTDAGGIVYHSNFLKFFERARTEMLRSMSFEQDQLMGQGIAFVVKHLAIDYQLPAKFNDLLTVVSRITQVKRASVVFDQQIFSSSGNLICTAEVVVVCIDHQSMKATAIPDNISKEFLRAR